jgi:hypothetical protein
LAATVRADTAAAVADPLGRSSAPMSDGQIATVCGTLDRHDVEYVVVGGAAAQLHGAPTARTRDVDVVPGRSADNLQRLAQALDEMNARMWVGEHEPDGIPTPFGATFQGPFDTFLNLITDHGPLDINLYIDGAPTVGGATRTSPFAQGPSTSSARRFGSPHSKTSSTPRRPQVGRRTSRCCRLCFDSCANGGAERRRLAEPQPGVTGPFADCRKPTRGSSDAGALTASETC